MLPLEIVFFMLVVLWGLIGSVRGFARETGSTISIILAMAALSYFGPTIINVVNRFTGALFSFKIQVATSVPQGQSAFCYTPSAEQFIFYVVAFSIIVFWGYQGQTLALPQNLGQVSGPIVGFFVGLINGWLVAGNLWYFLAKCANYSVPALGINSVGTLSQTASTLYSLVPFNTPIGSPVALMGLLFVLLILRIAP